MSARLGLKGIPSEAEEIVGNPRCLLARRTGGHVHLAHMSTKGSVELIRWGKERGINVTAEVCPHHLSLTERGRGLQHERENEPAAAHGGGHSGSPGGAARLGTMNVVATDHAPHHYDEKEREFADAPNGIVGLETALGVNVTTLVDRGILTWAQLIESMSVAPARLAICVADRWRRERRET